MIKNGIQVGYLKKVINIFEKKINITFAIETLFFNI